MRAERNLDERAWIGINKLDIENSGTNASQTDFKVEFQNTGKTPAINVRIWIDQGMDLKDDWKNVQPEGIGPFKFSGMLSPNAIGTLSTIENPINQQVVEAIKHRMPYFVFGKIWYDDMFGKHHWIEFCFVVRLTPQFSALPYSRHNSCDDAPTNQSN